MIKHKVRRVKETAHQWMNDEGVKLYILPTAAVALSLAARFYRSFPGDVALIQWVQTWRQPVTTTFMEALSLIGKSWLLIGMAGAVTAGLYVAHRRRAYTAAVGVLVILCLTPILQLLVDRPRPPADLVGLNDPLGGLGFPSGHAYQSFVLFSFFFHLATILINRTWLRRSVQALLIFLILGIGISRVYLGAHWPSDVLGGYLLGGSFLSLLLRGYQNKARVAAPQ